MIKASFIIVNYNRKQELLITIAKTLEVIGNDLSLYEIIIVDNASTDGSRDAIKEQFPNIILIENLVNTGAPAWNLGFAIAKGKYFIILDDDSQLDSGLNGALSFLDSQPHVGVLALNITGGAFQTNHWNDCGEYAGFIGCGAIIKKELYDKIGGYADWIFLYTNEYEYGIRCLNAGYKILFYKDCHVTHRTSSINRSNQRLITFSVRNEMAIVFKYFSKKHRNLYLTRVFLNNLKGIFKYGLKSVSWYVTALKEFHKIKTTLVHTPVKPEVEKFYSEDVWSTKKFAKII
ncbi:glycosyltransferase family 2 protein [Mucilaginibacter ginkgonis]|uniref:Glycosyltransferase n=1 Tax=Mucilaginibacter ginkgonis TaxID=2682091 RepID=A0A6I4HUC9_9SPHI|nr:glycosyltransferase [Mucilaginibacter ginkgonis]QQL50205.1 glycosyltransferase [Mucilaginibacter ginkgonis]